MQTHQEIVSSQDMNTAILSQFKSLFHERKNVVIIGHKNPDGDAIGASLDTMLKHQLVPRESRRD